MTANTARPDSSDARGSAAAQLGGLGTRPAVLTQSGLPLEYAADLLSKHLLAAGVLSVSVLVRRMGLAGSIVDQLLTFMKREARIEVRPRGGETGELHFALTERGRQYALDAQGRDGYLGPAPVPLADYATVVARQSLRTMRVTADSLRHALADAVVSNANIYRLGPALNSGRAIFIYGAAGTGKSFVARRLVRALPGPIWVPHAIYVNDCAVQVFDPMVHEALPEKTAASALVINQEIDPRFVCCQRPLVVAGGELTLDMLDVHIDTRAGRQVAPLQMRANNGVLLIDDLGRQKAAVNALLNRWIIPMEEGRDHLTSGTGQHFTVPFDMVLIFATNLDPAELADDAFLRRIGYKIEFKPVTPAEYRRIWAGVCENRKLDVDPYTVEFLISELHAQSGVPLLPCHPRDLLGLAQDWLNFGAGETRIVPEAIAWAWDNYFVGLPDAVRERNS